MKIALFGASGNIGKRIGAEALERGHEVTAFVRRVSASENRRMQAISLDILNTEAVAKVLPGYDVVISAVSPVRNAQGDQMLSQAATSVMTAMLRAKVKRLIVVGGAGSLIVPSGQQLVDTPDFPHAWKSIALAHRDAMMLYLGNSDLDWTYMSPAALIEPGQRTGKFRLGSDKLMADGQGNSRISMEDFAVAVLNEVEKPQAIKKRLTAAY